MTTRVSAEIGLQWTQSLKTREQLKPYLAELYTQASTDGSPLLRPLFYEFSADERAWDIYDEFMLGPRYLVAPILELGARHRNGYLPKGTGREVGTSHTEIGPIWIVADAPLEHMPVYELVG